jgi:hypothetical protein
MEVTLTMKQVNRKPPNCPVCERRTQQHFKAPAIVGSTAVRAQDLAYDIAENDYQVADMRASTEAEGKLDVRYKDVRPAAVEQAAAIVRANNASRHTTTAPRSTWGTTPEVLEQAVALGRQTRKRYGSGLDVLQRNLADGTQVDLIEASKRRAMKVW